SSDLPEQRLGPQSEHDTHRFHENSSAHLRATERSIDEDDRHLDYAKAAPQGAVGHFDLERIAIGMDGSEIDAQKRRTAEGLVPGGEIAHRHAENQPRVERAAL